METNSSVCRVGFLSSSRGDGFCPQLSQNPARHSGEYWNKNGIRSSIRFTDHDGLIVMDRLNILYRAVRIIDAAETEKAVKLSTVVSNVFMELNPPTL